MDVVKVLVVGADAFLMPPNQYGKYLLVTLVTYF